MYVNRDKLTKQFIESCLGVLIASLVLFLNLRVDVYKDSQNLYISFFNVDTEYILKIYCFKYMSLSTKEPV